MPKVIMQPSACKEKVVALSTCEAEYRIMGRNVSNRSCSSCVSLCFRDCSCNLYLS